MARSDSAKSSSLAKFGAIVSVISLFLSVFTFFYTYLRPASLSLTVGDGIFISYGYDHNLGATVPLSYANSGARSGSIGKLTLKCVVDTTGAEVSLYPMYYAEYANGGGYRMGAFIITEIVKGGDQFTRLPIFWSAVDSINQHDFSIGERTCTIVSSVDGKDVAPIAHFSFNLRKEDIDCIKSKAPATANRFVFTNESGVSEATMRTC